MYTVNGLWSMFWKLQNTEISHTGCPKKFFTDIMLVLWGNITLFTTSHQGKVTVRAYRNCASWWCGIRMQAEALVLISLFNAQHVSDVNTSILRSLWLICWVIACVVSLWYELRCGLAGVVWYSYAGFSLHKNTTPLQPNHNITPTRIEPEQYNPWNNSTNKSPSPVDGCK